MQAQHQRIEPVVYLLTVLLIFFTCAVFCAEWWFKSDGAFFQSISTVFGMVAGALMMKIKSDISVSPSPPPPGSTTDTQVRQVVTTPPDPPAETPVAPTVPPDAGGGGIA